MSRYGSGSQHSPMAASTTYRPSDGMLVVKNLTKKFGGLTAVDQLSFAVKKKEILGFIGPNGAGKSTTFNCITGKYEPTAGDVWYQGENVTRSNSHEMVKRGVARTFQDFEPLEDRSVEANVRLSLIPDRLFPVRLQGDSAKNRKEALKHQLKTTMSDSQREDTGSLSARICDKLGLEGVLQKRPDQLSHGSVIRLELAKAIATGPDLLLVDEPFAGLSANEVDELSEILLELRNGGMTIIVVDHNMRGLLELVDRAIVIQFGSRIAEGTPEDIINDATVQEAYLGGSENRDNP